MNRKQWWNTHHCQHVSSTCSLSASSASTFCHLCVLWVLLACISPVIFHLPLTLGSQMLYEHDCTAVKTGAFLQEPSKSQPTFGVRLLYVKAFCKWTYCGFPDTRRPPTQLLSACWEQLVNKQLDHYLAILQTWHTRTIFHARFSESCVS